MRKISEPRNAHGRSLTNVRFPPIADIESDCQSATMLIVPRLITLAAIALFLFACAYVGYINEQLKGAVADPHRAIVMIGFIIGAGAISKHLSLVAMKSYRKVARQRRA